MPVIQYSLLLNGRPGGQFARGGIAAGESLILQSTAHATRGTVRSNDNFIIGEGGAGLDYTLTFDGETNDGLITWMEDEDYFQFSDHLLMQTNRALYFGITANSLSLVSGFLLTLDSDLDMLITADGGVIIQSGNTGDTIIGDGISLKVGANSVLINTEFALSFTSLLNATNWGLEWATLGILNFTYNSTNLAQFNAATNVFTWGSGAAGIDYQFTFNGETNDGVLKWMEDEDYFQFQDSLFMLADRFIYFKDTNSYIRFQDPLLRIQTSTEMLLVAGSRSYIDFTEHNLLFGNENFSNSLWWNINWATSSVLKFTRNAVDEIQFNGLTRIITLFQTGKGGSFTIDYSVPTVLHFNNQIRAGSGVFDNLTSGRVVIAGTSGVLGDDADLTFSVDTLSSTKVAVKAGTSTGNIAKVGGTVYQSLTQVNNSGTGETTLWSQSVAANALSANGQALHFYIAGTVQTSLNNKQIRVKFGATTIFDSTSQLPLSAVEFCIEGWIIRTGAATQKCITKLVANAGAFRAADYATAAETLSGAVTFAVTGQGGASSEITFEFGSMEWQSAP